MEVLEEGRMSGGKMVNGKWYGQYGIITGHRTKNTENIMHPAYVGV